MAKYSLDENANVKNGMTFGEIEIVRSNIFIANELAEANRIARLELAIKWCKLEKHEMDVASTVAEEDEVVSKGADNSD